MNSDYSSFAAMGIVGLLIAVVLYLAVLALMVWIGYLILRTAVTNGILRADQKRAERGYPPRF